MLSKFKKIVAVTIGIATVTLFGCAGYLYVQKNQASQNQTIPQSTPLNLFSPLTNKKNTPSHQEKDSKILGDYHILLLGTDKRVPEQNYYRTDAIMLVSIIKDEKRIILTSIPRDLWLSGTKINAHYANEGFDKFKHRVGKVLGIEPDYFVSIGFEGFVQSMNKLGSVRTNIERSFVDPHYPHDREPAPQHISFDAGIQELNAEEALIYCRSRKGTNGEGSDFQRIRRQQNLLVSFPQTFTNSHLVTLSAKALYNLFIGHMQTNLGVGEITELLPIVKDWKNYQIDRFVLDTTNYLYEQPRSNYGGAYVLKPHGDSFEAIHQAVLNKLTK